MEERSHILQCVRIQYPQHCVCFIRRFPLRLSILGHHGATEIVIIIFLAQGISDTEGEEKKLVRKCKRCWSAASKLLWSKIALNR